MIFQRFQVVMLTFWVLGVVHVEEIPDFIKLYDEYNDDGLEIMEYNTIRTSENIKRFSDYYKINYTILTDIDSYESAKAFYEYGRVTGVGTRQFRQHLLIEMIHIKHIGLAWKVFYNDLQPYL